MRGIRPPLPALLSLFWEKVQRHNQEQVGIGFLGVLCTVSVGNFEIWENLISGVSSPSHENFTSR